MSQDGDLITVDYLGQLENGKVFDGSIQTKINPGHAPISFTLGAHQVIKGWEQGLLNARIGSVRKLVIPPSMAYGNRQVGPIPPNSTLVFEVRLLGVLKKGKKQMIEIQELAPGSGANVKDGDSVDIHYTGTFLNGQKFDSSLDRGVPLTFRVGAGQVVPGFDMAVLGMKKGGKRKVTIPPELAYGERGAGGVIPPNATLNFQIEIVNIK